MRSINKREYYIRIYGLKWNGWINIYRENIIASNCKKKNKKKNESIGKNEIDNERISNKEIIIQWWLSIS